MRTIDAEYEAMREVARTRRLTPAELARWDALQEQTARESIGNPPPRGHDSWEEYSLATR